MTHSHNTGRLLSVSSYAAWLMVMAAGLLAASTWFAVSSSTTHAQEQVAAQKLDKNVLLYEDFEGDKPRTPLENVGRGWENVSKKNDGIVPRLCVGTGRSLKGQALGFGTGGKKHLWTNINYRKPLSHELGDGQAFEVSFMISADPTHKYARFYRGAVTLISGDTRLMLLIDGKHHKKKKPLLVLNAYQGDQKPKSIDVQIKDQATADGRGFYFGKMIVTPDKTTLVTSEDGENWTTTDQALSIGLRKIDHVELNLYPIGYWSGMDEVKVKTIPAP